MPSKSQKKAKGLKAKKPLATKTAATGKPLPGLSSGSTRASMPPPRRSAVQSALVHRTTAEIAVSEKHSIELAKTMMTAAVSTVVALRNIFPRIRYAIRQYDCADPQFTYQAFMNGMVTDIPFEATAPLFNWRILQRDTDEIGGPVNKLLDWIEISATQALELKYLAKLQLSFHSIDDTPVSDANLLEAYNICFTYHYGGVQVGTEKGASSLSLEGARDEQNRPASHEVALGSAKKDLYTLVNDIVTMIQESEPLPDGRRMKMAMAFNKTCPPDYQPPGFHDDTNTNSLIASNKGSIVGSMTTGYHGIAISLFKQRIDEFANQSRRRTSEPPCKQIREPSLSSEIDGDETQPHGLKLLEGMGKHRAPETQDTLRFIDMAALASQEQATTISQTRPTFLPYSQNIIQAIENKRQSKADQHKYQESLEATDLFARTGTCECGIQISDENYPSVLLLKCDICDNFKHVHCYGHLDAISQLSKFACYSCIIEDKTQLGNMQNLCVKRRALYYLREHVTLNSVEELAQHLQNASTELLLSELDGDGYIQRAANFQKSKKGKGKEKLMEPFVQYVSNDDEISDDIFRPDFNMGLFLDLDNSPFRASLLLRSENAKSQLAQGEDVENFLDDLSAANQDLGHTPYRRRAPGEDSTTEGTPSIELDNHRAILQNKPAASGGRHPASGAYVENPFGGLLVSSKRRYDESTPDLLSRQGSMEEQASITRKRMKTSDVNSPWTFRGTA